MGWKWGVTAKAFVHNIPIILLYHENCSVSKSPRAWTVLFHGVVIRIQVYIGNSSDYFLLRREKDSKSVKLGRPENSDLCAQELFSWSYDPTWT